MSGVNADRIPRKAVCFIRCSRLLLRKGEQAELKRVPVGGKSKGAERAILPYAKKRLQTDDSLLCSSVKKAGNFPFIKAEGAQLRLQRFHILAKIPGGKNFLRRNFRHSGRGKRGAA